MNKKRKAPSSRSKKASINPAKRVTGLIKKALIVIAFLAVPIAWLIANEHTARETSDLSVVGSGTPVAVQIHDHSCPLCQRLKANAENALDQMDTPPAWRIVDINTAKGADFARQHGVGHVTILLFDAQGQRQDTIQGVTGINALRDSFEQLNVSRR